MPLYRVTRDNNRHTNRQDAYGAYYKKGDIIEVEDISELDSDDEVYSTTANEKSSGWGYISADALELVTDAPVLDEKVLAAAIQIVEPRFDIGDFLAIYDAYNKIKEALA